MSYKIALAGNPNSGKTTLFNALTGSNQFVGNWPGVTVEKKEGKLKGYKADDVILVDLPGIYSLSPYTLEEVVSRNFLLGESPDVIINIIDGTNLERNLYLTTQLLETGIPMILAINMMDVVVKSGDMIDCNSLSKKFRCKVVTISALKSEGIEELAKEAVSLAKNPSAPYPVSFGKEVEGYLGQIANLLMGAVPASRMRWYAVKLFEKDEKVLEESLLPEGILRQAADITEQAERDLEEDTESIITCARYDRIGELLNGTYHKSRKDALSASDKIDRVVTSRWLGLPIFALVMFLVYYISVTTVGDFVTGWTNDVLFGEIIPPAVESFLQSVNTADWLQGLILEGIIGGVGAVLGFVPQMLMLFLLLAFLEACGYMARIAFIMDRVFRRFGLSGKSFIPILIGTGCGIPGIMASRTIENERDRRMTVITTTFIPCGAKLPIIALIAGAMFDGAWWVSPSAYFLGIGAILISGIILKKTKRFLGNPAPFVMELPSYHMPTLGNILRSTWERGWSFIKKAGSVILISAIVIWFFSSFGLVDGTFGMVEDLNDGLLAAVGKWFAWIFIPLGFGDWQSVVATIAGLVAKENVVNTFGILFGMAEVAEDGAEIWGTLQAHYSGLAAYSFLAFNLLCAPCFAAIGAIKREMNSAKWTWFAILYQTGFAYGVALVIYQLGMLLTQGVFGVFTILALLVLAGGIYALLRKAKKL